MTVFRIRSWATCGFIALAPMIARADWSGTEGPYSITQTTQDITVKASNRTVFSARAFAAAQYAKLLVEFGLPLAPSGSSPSLHVRHTFQFVSLTGSLLAVRDEADLDVKGNAIPSGRARFWTIDVRKGARYGFEDDPLGPSPNMPSAVVDLRSLFPDKAIATAAAASDLGRQAGAKAGDGLPGVMYDLAILGRKNPNCFMPGPDTTWSFALVGLNASVVNADLGLQGQSNCRTNLTTLHLTLPRAKSRMAFGPPVLPPPGLSAALVEIGSPASR